MRRLRLVTVTAESRQLYRQGEQERTESSLGIDAGDYHSLQLLGEFTKKNTLHLYN